MARSHLLRLALPAALVLPLGACLSSRPEALGSAEPGSGPVVKFDVFHKPLPEIPLPNDFATRFDGTSPTRRRLNASIIAAPTEWERSTRADLNKLTGWGTLAPISVSFSADIDPEVIFARHHRDNLAFGNDAVLVLDVTPGSPGLCEAVPLDLGQGNYPQVLPNPDLFEADPRAGLQTVLFEEVEEDSNGNGVLDPGEDTDMDGVLDHPNTRDGKPGSQLLEFYERETHTLIMKPMMPMREKTTYAVVLTKRLTSTAGEPVRSPFAGINHTSQTGALARLPECLGRYGLGVSDVAFTWSFTTQSITHEYQLVRDGLYGLGKLAHLAKDFPAILSNLPDVRDAGPGVTGIKRVPGEQFALFAKDFYKLAGDSEAEAEMFLSQLRFVDFVVGGEVQSPQFYRRTDDKGAMLPLHKQIWDLDAPPRAETVRFWMFVPKKRSGPAPVAFFIHGHGGSKFDALAVAGLMAGYGIATVGFEAPGHSVGLSNALKGVVRDVFKQKGLGGLGELVLTGRALDWNGDGELDSGADYWTSYVFHTRDQVRQTMVDLMQLVRVMRGFDGKTRWAFDPNGTGTPGLAGDFDGDGTVDVGGSAPLHVMGGSLGGITSGVAAGVEPALDTAIAIVPGGMLGEIGGRSNLGGIRNSMVMRAMQPLLYPKEGTLRLKVNEAEGEERELVVGPLPSLVAGDTVVVINKKTKEHRCALVRGSEGGAVTFRGTVATDEGDPLEVRFYRGALPSVAPEGCKVTDAAPLAVLDTFADEAKYGAKIFAKGSPLVSPTDGFGQRRATPDIRRFFGLAQIALEQADPMNWATYWNRTREMTYGTGETVETRVLVVPSAGDPGVPVANGIALARAAGMVPYDRDDPRWGKSANQVLIDTWAVEGIPRTARYLNSKGEPVIMDVEHLAEIMPVDDGLDVPRLSPPLRLVQQDPKTGTWAGLIIPMLSPKGKHGFVTPDATRPFNLGGLLFSQFGRFVASSGREFSWDSCQALMNCSWIPVPPPAN